MKTHLLLQGISIDVEGGGALEPAQWKHRGDGVGENKVRFTRSSKGGKTSGGKLLQKRFDCHQVVNVQLRSSASTSNGRLTRFDAKDKIKS